MIKYLFDTIWLGPIMILIGLIIIMIGKKMNITDVRVIGSSYMFIGVGIIIIIDKITSLF